MHKYTKPFGNPAQNKFVHGKILDVGDGKFEGFVLRPGWRWANDVRSRVKTESRRTPESH